MDRIRIVVGIASLCLAVPALAGEPSRSFELDGNTLKLPAPLSFEAGTDKLAASAKPALEHLKAYLEAKSYVSMMRLEGHTSSAEKGGQALSEKRAMAVAKWLVGQGTDCKRLVPVGFGDTKPVATNSTAEGRAQNERITAVNAMLRNRPIGGMPVDGGGSVAGDPCAK